MERELSIDRSNRKPMNLIVIKAKFSVGTAAYRVTFRTWKNWVRLIQKVSAVLWLGRRDI